MRARSRSVAWEQILPPATLLLVALVAAGPVWGPGLLNTRGGGDSPFLLVRTDQLVANLRVGAFPVRWMPDAAYGFGYPFFSYYAALPYYIAAGLTLIGLDILTAIKLTQTLFFAAAALAMYRWAERVLRSRSGAWLAAVAYTAAPFHLVNVYVRGDSLSEFAAFAFYPIVLYGLDRLAVRPSVQRAVLPSLAYAGLILTHNASALIFSPFALLYGASLVARVATGHASDLGEPGPSRRTVFGAVTALALLLGLLLSAWFWLPALAERDYVQLGAQTTGYFFYGNHFRWQDLVQRSAVFDFETGVDHPSPFAMGGVQAATTLIGVVVAVFGLARRRQASRGIAGVLSTSNLPRHHPGLDPLDRGFAILGLLLATWLITPVSRPLWAHLPLLPLVQFPWRFLSVQSLFAAVLTGGALVPVQRRGGFRVAWGAALVLAAILATTSLCGLAPEYMRIRADEVDSERLGLYELFTTNVGSTIRHEYLPRWVEPRPYAGPSHVDPEAPPRAMPVSGELLGAERTELSPVRQRWRVEAGAGGVEVAFPLYYWPGWRAAVDGRRAAAQPVVGSGYLSVQVPAGRHEVQIWLGRTSVRLAAELASLAVGVGILGLWVRSAAKGTTWGRDERGGGFSRQLARFWASCSTVGISGFPFIVAVGLLIAVHPRVTAHTGRDLTMDFDHMPYLHHNPEGVAFDGWRMTAYSYNTTRIAPGEPLYVTLEWQTSAAAPGADSLSGEPMLRLVSPAGVRQDRVPPVAEASIGFDSEQGGGAGRSILSLVVPADAPTGIHLVEISGPPVTYLQPVWITGRDVASGRVALAAFSEGKVRLHSVDAMQPMSDRLDVQLAWSTDEPLAVNYGLALSLVDVAGNEWLQQHDRLAYDTQPGLGYLPTSLWPVGRVIDDNHIPALQPAIPPSDHYTLTVKLYNVATWESVGEYATGVSLPRVSTQPDAPILAILGDGVDLSRLDVPRSVGQGEKLEVKAYWLISRRPTRGWVTEWRLELPEQDSAGYSWTRPMAPGSSPTVWPAGAWVAGRVALPVPPLAPPGENTLSLVLRDPASGVTLGSYTHPEPIRIRELERVWELPSPAKRLGAQFGGMIELAGYEVAQKKDSLDLTLHWRALSTPDRHYTYFVHLADPGTGRPVVQLDTMPRAFAYPTGLWAPGEIVSEEVALAVDGVAGGRYELAVGWYDPETMERLPVVDGRGERVLDDRLILSESIVLD